MLTESVLLSLSGAAAGLVIAYWSVPALLALTPPAYLPATGVRIDAPVLGATAVVAVVTGLLLAGTGAQPRRARISSRRSRTTAPDRPGRGGPAGCGGCW